ncbi:MAG: hypothetical protein ACFE9M_13910 [Promethearchaeota archaeon]
MSKNILDETKRNEPTNKMLTNIESVIKKDFKASIMNWQYRKKMDRMVEKLQSRLENFMK